MQSIVLTDLDEAQRAADLLVHIANMKDRVNDILDPMIDRLLRGENADEIQAIIAMLPKGRHRKILKRGLHQIEQGFIPQGIRHEMTIEQIQDGARVIYSDAYLERHAMWVVDRTLLREGTVVGREFFDAKHDPVKEPVPYGIINVLVEWDDGDHENTYLDYDQMRLSEVSVV